MRYDKHDMTEKNSPENEARKVIAVRRVMMPPACTLSDR